MLGGDCRSFGRSRGDGAYDIERKRDCGNLEYVAAPRHRQRISHAAREKLTSVVRVVQTGPPAPSERPPSRFQTPVTRKADPSGVIVIAVQCFVKTAPTTSGKTSHQFDGLTSNSPPKQVIYRGFFNA